MNHIRTILLFTLVIAVAGSVGSCRRAEKTEVTEQPPPAQAETESPAPEPKLEIPESAMTESLRYLGAPFANPIKFKFTGSPITEATLTYVVESVKDGQVVVKAQWDNAALGSEVYESKPDGVWYIEVRGERLSQPVLFLPSNVSVGKRWTQDYTMTMNGEKLRVVNRIRIVGREKVTVPLGEFDALVIEQTSTLTSPSTKLSVSGKTRLAQGVGIIQSTLKNKGTRNNEKVDMTIEIVATK